MTFPVLLKPQAPAGGNNPDPVDPDPVDPNAPANPDAEGEAVEVDLGDTPPPAPPAPQLPPQLGPGDLSAPPPPLPNPEPESSSDDGDSYSHSSGFLSKFHASFAFGGAPVGVKFAPVRGNYADDAPEHTGFSLWGEFAYDVFHYYIGKNARLELPIGLRAGAHLLSSPNIPGVTDENDSDIQVAFIAPSIAFHAFHTYFGGGVSVQPGYAGVVSTSANIGDSWPYTMEFGKQGGLFIGAQVFACAWNCAIRVGAAFDSIPMEYKLPSTEGQPDHQMPGFTLISPNGSLDIARIVDNVVK